MNIKNQADGSGRQTLKIGRNKKVRFNGEVQAKDQEVLIYGAPHLKTISGMDGIKPRHLLLNNAHKLTAVECPNNTELINIQIDNCSYLQRLDLRGCSSLGNLTSSQVLIVDGCNNLRYLNAYGTIITSIRTNQEGGNLVELYVPQTLQTLSLRNQYSLTTIGIPNANVHGDSRLYDLRNKASKIATFSLINCPLVNRLTYNSSYNVNHNFFDIHGNERTSSEISSLTYVEKWRRLMDWGNGLANASEIHIENSCLDIEEMSFRGSSKLENLTLRNLPNLKTLMIGGNCSGYRWNSQNNNYESDRYDTYGEFDWSGLVIRDCPNIEDFRFQELFPFNWNGGWDGNLSYLTFKEGTNSINLGEKFPNLKTFFCNLPTQNIHQIILPQSLTCLNTSAWQTKHDEGYPHEVKLEKFNIDSIYFEGEHTDDYVGVDLGNHLMHDVRIVAPYSTELVGLNIKNEWVNPIFQTFKEDGHEARPSLTPQGKIDLSEFKWKRISNWFQYIDFTKGTCEIVQPTNWDSFLKNIERAGGMFYRCKNPNFTWEFAMKFFGKMADTSDKNTMYKYAQLKEQTSFEEDAVDMISNKGAFYYDYGAKPFQGTNLKYVKSIQLTATDGCYGMFQGCESIIKVGNISMTGNNNNWDGNNAMFNGAINLEEVGNIYSTRNKENGTTTSCNEYFRNCKKLRKVGKINMSISNGNYMFNECVSLVDGSIKQLPYTGKMTTAYYMFRNTRFTTIELENLSSLENADNMFSANPNLKTIHLPNINRTSPLNNLTNTFNSDSSLTKITIEGDTLPIGLKNMNGTFNGCKSLTSLPPIPQDFTYDINMGYCCYNCDSLTDDTIYKVIPYRCTHTQYMYSHCDGLINPVVEVKSDNVYARQMFERCKNIKTLTVNFTGRLLRESMYFAQYCTNMTEFNMKFPDSLYMHDYYETGVGHYNMLEYCENLSIVNLDMSSLSKTNTRSDFGAMFYQDKHITEIHGLDLTYLKKFTHPLTSNGQSAYDWHNDSITYGGSYDDLSVFELTGKLNTSYNFRNITTITHTKEILKHLDVVTNETLGLTYNIMDAIDDELNEYVDPELKQLALTARDNGWTFVVV